MPSSPQTVTTKVVFDYVVDTTGAAVKGATVNCTLNYAGASVTSPVVNIGPIQQATTTDSNGYWQFTLISNASLTPSGTSYTVQTPYNSYDISVPSAAGPFQSSSILVNAPSTVSPAVTGLTGPLTVTGNETVTGNLTVSGTTTLAGTTTGALTTAAASIGGDLTILSAFRLLFGAAASKLVPGATSFAIRDNADANNNLLVSNAGDVTVRARLLMATAVSKIIPGATSISLRNNADSADNMLVSDAGLATYRNAILVPPTAGGSAAPTSYGSLALKFDEQTPTGVATATFNLPSGFKHAHFRGQVRSTTAAANADLYAQFNGDTASSYVFQQMFGNNNAATSSQSASSTAQAAVARVPASTALANAGGTFSVDIENYTGTTFIKEAIGYSTSWEGAGIANEWVLIRSIRWNSTAALTSVVFGLSAGNYVTGSIISGWVWP